ncbi:unnamed protein product [Cylicocyclus nassatus]|uniref:Uncharacterized protein n=1 Tax=Cylicocyclus nassatus TaxID=53992 RepID=A0AA36H4I1_CYLNA|nr:unnamed protein product [Cylicocyclus nassatus]
MNAQLFILLAFLPALLAQLYGIANPGMGMGGGATGCNGYLRFAARAGIRPYGFGMGGSIPMACPCPGAGSSAYNVWPSSLTTPANVILNACVPACCPNLGK